MSATRSADEAAPRGRLFHNVLFAPLARRGNAAALRRVCGLAGVDGGTITVVGVIDEPTRLQRLLHGSEHVERVLAAEHRVMQQRLDRCTRSVEGCDVTTIIDMGSSSLMLLKRAIAAQHDLLVVTSDEDEEDQATVKRLMRKSPQGACRSGVGRDRPRTRRPRAERIDSRHRCVDRRSGERRVARRERLGAVR